MAQTWVVTPPSLQARQVILTHRAEKFGMMGEAEMIVGIRERRDRRLPCCRIGDLRIVTEAHFAIGDGHENVAVTVDDNGLTMEFKRVAHQDSHVQVIGVVLSWWSVVADCRIVIRFRVAGVVDVADVMPALRVDGVDR